MLTVTNRISNFARGAPNKTPTISCIKYVVTLRYIHLIESGPGIYLEADKWRSSFILAVVASPPASISLSRQRWTVCSALALYRAHYP